MGLPLAMMWLGDCLRRSAEPALLVVKRGHTREPHVRVAQLAEMPHARHQRQPRARADVLLQVSSDLRRRHRVGVIHGGPQAASVERFNLLTQMIAAKGYITFEPNYRGSDHLGDAYQHAIVKDWGEGPGKDVMAGIETLKGRGFVDAERIAVTGWSYGGYMTTWLIGHYHIWKAAMAGAAVTDWVDMYNLGDGNVQLRYSFEGTPWAGDALRSYREQSPITYARQIKT